MPHKVVSDLASLLLPFLALCSISSVLLSLIAVRKCDLCVCVNMHVYELLYGKKLENQMRTVFSCFHKSSVYGFHPVGSKATHPVNSGSVGENPPAPQETRI